MKNKYFLLSVIFFVASIYIGEYIINLYMAAVFACFAVLLNWLSTPGKFKMVAVPDVVFRIGIAIIIILGILAPIVKVVPNNLRFGMFIFCCWISIGLYYIFYIAWILARHSKKISY